MRVLQSHYEMPPAGTNRGKINYVIIHLHVACAFVCFCVCFCHTHELHPVLIKAGCSFYIITECGACLQQILLLSLLFAAPQSSSRHIHHPAIPPYCSPSLCNLLHASLLLPLSPSHVFTSLTHLPPMHSPMMPKKCSLNFYPADLSGASCLPLNPPRLLSFFHHL